MSGPADIADGRVEVRVESGADLAAAVAELLPLDDDLAYANFAPIVK